MSTVPNTIRERAEAYGAKTLTDSELVSLVAGIDHDKASAMLAGSTLVSMAQATTAPDGATKTAAARLAAAFEIGRRMARGEAFERAAMGHPAAVASYLALRYGVRDQEVMGALYLDTRHRLLAELELYRGTVNRAAVEPRLILKQGLLHGACGVVVFHTHPSGDPSPSAEDVAFTRRLAEGGELVGIRLVDHLVLGGVGRWVSMRERGAW